MHDSVVKLISVFAVVALFCWVFVQDNIGVWLCGIALVALGAFAAVTVEVANPGSNSSDRHRR